MHHANLHHANFGMPATLQLALFMTPQLSCIMHWHHVACTGMQHHHHINFTEILYHISPVLVSLVCLHLAPLKPTFLMILWRPFVVIITCSLARWVTVVWLLVIWTAVGATQTPPTPTTTTTCPAASSLPTLCAA